MVKDQRVRHEPHLPTRPCVIPQSDAPVEVLSISRNNGLGALETATLQSQFFTNGYISPSASPSARGSAQRAGGRRRMLS